MQDDPSRKFKCAVMDEGPDELFPENHLAVQIFDQAEGDANQVQGELRVWFYLDPKTVESLMNTHGIPQEDRPWLMKKVMKLQDLKNGMRPISRKK